VEIAMPPSDATPTNVPLPMTPLIGRETETAAVIDLMLRTDVRLVTLRGGVGQMDTQVTWMLEVAVKPGQIESFRTLMEEMVASTRAEPGALYYAWFVSDDGSVVHIAERYADSTAVLNHLGTFGEKFAGRFLDKVDPTRFTVLGSPSNEVKAALDGFAPTYLGPFGGFARKTDL
jgi:quinol monooxygenase YgiN